MCEGVRVCVGSCVVRCEVCVRGGRWSVEGKSV